MAASSPDLGLSRRRFSIGGPLLRWEWLGLAATGAGYLLIVLVSVRRGAPLGWDESVYALRARDFATGADPRQYWDAFRAPGLPWLIHLLWWEGREATLGRLVVSGFGLGLAAVAWALTRHLFGRRAALLAAAGVAVTPPLVLAATQVWPDVPGACLGLAAITLFVLATGGDRPSWWMLAAVPAMGAATYLRFGAPLPMVIGLLGMAWWRRRTLWRFPWPAVATALAGAATVAAVLEVPALTGSGGAPLRAIASFPRSVGEGFGDYLNLADEVIGPAAIVLAFAGLLAAFAWAGRGVDRGALWTATLIGLATGVTLAVVLHGEVRYLAPAFPWLWVAGAPGLERVGGLLPERWRAVVAAGVALALAAAVVGAALERNREASAAYRTTRRAAEAISTLAAGSPCTVVTSRVPQVLWYSGCATASFDLEEVRFPEPPDRSVFMLLVGGFPRQPEGDLLEAYREAAGEPVLVVEGGRRAEVYLIAEAPATG
jgi:hypothetical protein